MRKDETPVRGHVQIGGEGVTVGVVDLTPMICDLMGNLMPFLRELYGISYAQAGLLLSLPSWGNLASIFITGYLPTYIGRRKTVLLTSVWMFVAFALVTFGLGGAAILPLVYREEKDNF